MYIIVGLGNPGEEYKLTRHNTGRMIVEEFAKKQKFPLAGREWVFDEKINALKSECKVGKPRKSTTTVARNIYEQFWKRGGKSRYLKEEGQKSGGCS